MLPRARTKTADCPEQDVLVILGSVLHGREHSPDLNNVAELRDGFVREEELGSGVPGLPRPQRQQVKEDPDPLCPMVTQ